VQGVFTEGGFRFPLTSRWDGDASDASIEVAPAIYQEYIPKRQEIRAVIVGNRVFAATVNSQAHPEALDDVRGLPPDVAYEAHDLPPAIGDRLVEMTRRFGIQFASADLVLTPSGEYVFLDLNPNGQWLWLELDAGLPLTDALIGAMTDPALAGGTHR